MNRLQSILMTGIRNALNVYPRWLCQREFNRQEFLRFNERPVEFGFVFRKLAQVYPRTALDVGSGTTALPHLMRNCGCVVTAIDNIKDYWPYGMSNRHYHVIHDDITQTRLTRKFDFITCVSVLEHIEKADSAMANMAHLLEPGGYLVCTFPYSDEQYVRNVYELPGSSYGQKAPYITQSFSRREIGQWLNANGLELVEQEYWQFWEGDFWTQGKQVIPPQKVGVADLHQLTCVLLRRPE